MTMVTFICETCGRSCSRRHRSSAANRYCSQRCCGLSFLGTKQSPVHAASKGFTAGDRHPNWLGDAATERAGRTRALRAYPSVGPCTKCGASKAERHHADGDTLNNNPSNIEILCRRCHMDTDGRLDEAAERLRSVQPMGVAARWQRKESA